MAGPVDNKANEAISLFEELSEALQDPKIGPIIADEVLLLAQTLDSTDESLWTQPENWEVVQGAVEAIQQGDEDGARQAIEYLSSLGAPDAA